MALSTEAAGVGAPAKARDKLELAPFIGIGRFGVDRGSRPQSYIRSDILGGAAGADCRVSQPRNEALWLEH